MTAFDLINNLKQRKFKPLYLLHGEEPYYVDLISDYIENHVLSDAEKGFNQSVFYGKDSDLMSVLNSAKRFPMMSEYQVIIVKEAQDLKWGKDTDDPAKGIDPLLSYLQNPLSSTILVFCYKYAKFDKRKKTYKAIEKNGSIFESSAIYDNKVPAWIEDFLSARGYRIHARASSLIAEYLGADLSKIANELEKLILNVQPGEEITLEDVHTNIGISKDYNVFELQSAIATRNVIKGNQIINYFGANPKSNPVQLVFGALNSYFTKLLKYHYISDRSSQNLAKEIGVNPYFLKEYEVAANNYNVPKIFNIISYLREYDLKIKGVGATANTEQSDLMKELLFKIIH
jgi:DNA polymerase-3 subunit delta